jgi:hypothetical protein
VRLEIGDSGRRVATLQSMLNRQITVGTELAVDGVFGPLTLAQVRHFQRRFGLSVDGVVGRQTWFQLVAAPPPRRRRHTQGTLAPPPRVLHQKAAAQSAAEAASAAADPSVADWSLETRFEYVLKKTPDFLLGDLKAQLKAMVTGKGLAILVGTLVIWAGGHFFGVSEIADGVLLGAGLVFLGRAAIDAARLIKHFLELTVTASHRTELDTAAKCLSEAVTIIGVVAFFALVMRVGRRLGKRFRAPRDTTPPAVERALSTQENLQGLQVARSIALLEKPTVFRHTITGDVPPVNFARIVKEGILRFSTGSKAHYGDGVYAWEANTKGVGARYIDIEVPSGTAAELLVTQAGKWYRLVSPQGNSLSVRVVGHNFTAAEVEFGTAALGD